ncbi:MULTISPECIES: cytochrome c3 family protein [unclassified Novosphingobium]|uniref:cytochrome c3 family protein n=1 Tax=unclassified Novosphingobium TaxID=2644732 RepID=UPI001ACA6584|nr:MULTISPECIES: cytochrome c3 family protein [unclassified Novosphingobium]MBN9146480.1 class III cytochrome C family protein [Novosphingobium sp.]
MAAVKRTTILYLVLATIALLAAAAIPFTVYRSGSTALPQWSSAVRPGPLSSAHAFLEGKCESCHTPNQGIKAATCIACHASAPELLMKPATAFHANLKECAGCHIEHQGRTLRPVRMDHQILEEIARRTTGQAAKLDCQSCHAPRDIHKGFFGPECASCHTTESWKINGFLHPSPKSTECSQCHKAPPSHYMMHFEMMDKMISGEKRARVDQCFSCHQTDSFNNIKGVGMVKVH